MAAGELYVPTPTRVRADTDRFPQCMPRKPARAVHHVYLRRDRAVRLQHREGGRQRRRPGAQERVQQRCPRVRVLPTW